MSSRPEIVIRRFLRALAQRDAATATAQLAPGTVLISPGGVAHGSVEALFAASRLRYQLVDKSIETVDVLDRGDGRAVVHCHGTLFGRWADGTPFEGIRFIDRFELDGELITGHWVWNDVALHRPDLPGAGAQPSAGPQSVDTLR